jgi:type IV secretion system protein VirB2
MKPDPDSIRLDVRRSADARGWGAQGARRVVPAAVLFSVALPAFSQSSPFLTGATALQANILAWLTPIAIILVMVLGAMAMANRISWAWCIAAILGIAIAFGAPQIVTWVRGMFGV